MGILHYEDFETEEEVRARREAELEASNRNYTGSRLPERAPRRDSSSDEEPVICLSQIILLSKKNQIWHLFRKIIS